MLHGQPIQKPRASLVLSFCALQTTGWVELRSCKCHVRKSSLSRSACAVSDVGRFSTNGRRGCLVQWPALDFQIWPATRRAVWRRSAGCLSLATGSLMNAIRATLASLRPKHAMAAPMQAMDDRGCRYKTSRRLVSSESQLAMRAEAHQAQRKRVRLLVDQDQIRPDVTVAEAVPLITDDRNTSAATACRPPADRSPR